MANKKFSVIIPTFTGASTISNCFESILAQDVKNFEVVIIIDGPNKELFSICSKYKKIIEMSGIAVSLKQLSKNKGRFVARLEGAIMAKYNDLLFVDDRITFDSNYFSTITNIRKGVVIPNVSEGESRNPVSRCLYLLRKLVYGKKRFGINFKSYYITKKNFEFSPKGTTSLYIEKSDFVQACKSINEDGPASGKYVNEDTKIFKELLDKGAKLYKSNESVIYYHPREGAIDELKHIYHRGPRFVDYYMNPGTRFFPFLIFGIIAAPSILIASVVEPVLVLYLLALAIGVLMLMAAKAAMGVKDFFIIASYSPIIFLYFTCGVIKGCLLLVSRIGR